MQDVLENKEQKSFKILASPTVAAGFAGSELLEGNVKTAGASLLAPELAEH